MVIDKIEIINTLKQGGQKKVYLANSIIYGQVIYKTGVCQSESQLKRIQREIKLLKEINSIYFPKNYEFETYHNGEFEILEEYISPNNLCDCKNSFCSEIDISNMILHLISGMKLLWDNNVVHRDLKPDNILIKSSNIPVIIDLGIARVLNDESLTKSIYGRGPATPRYAAPEQLKNLKNQIGMRTDFFLIGIVMLELLLDEHPFSPSLVGSGLSIIDNIEKCNYTYKNNNKQASIKFLNIIKNLLREKPYERYRHYDLLVCDLKDLINEGAHRI